MLKTFDRLLQLTLADFRERTRRYSFLMTLLGVLFFGYLVITGKYTIHLGAFRTVYDSTWAGTLMALCGTVTLSMFGFYLVRGSIQRDVQTEVGQIIAASPLSKRAYLASKFLSNMLVLCVIVAVLAVVAFVTLLFQNEAPGIEVGAFVLPFVMVALPAMAFVAAAAVLFDSVRWLQGTVGNVIYFCAAETLLVLGLLGVRAIDLGGIGVVMGNLEAAAHGAFPGEKLAMSMGYVVTGPSLETAVVRSFHWGGIDWTLSAVLMRLFWVGAALLAVRAAVPFFDRFDPSKARRKKKRAETRPAHVAEVIEQPMTPVVVSYEGLPEGARAFRIASMVAAELRLALKGFHWFWYAIASGLIVAEMLAPFDIARQYLVPGAMIWPIVIWSSMGTREARFNTGQLLFGMPGALGRQLPAIWVSGVLVALIAVGPMVLRGLAGGETVYGVSIAVGAVMIPSAALALGVISGSRKLFEMVYLALWYIGSIDQLAAIDVLGTTGESVSGGKVLFLGVLSVAFLAAAFGARRYQMRYAE